MGIMAKQQQNSGILAKSIDCLELMREQMLTLQCVLERVESNKRRPQVCPEFCVNDRVLFSGMGCWGRGHFPFPSPSL
jgi:hypothetical protein